MKENILIVEDQFIEANDLRNILQKAGYRVCAISRSVEHAREQIRTCSPDIVLIDILLQGDLTGIDLARDLTASNTPFIFLSANSNQSTFNEAKQTQPYGFLVKPFREKDILVALEIAIYRHTHKIDTLDKHADWLSGMLSEIIRKDSPSQDKLLMLVNSFQPFIPFDVMIIDINSVNNPLTGFRRMGFDQYQIVDLTALEDSLILYRDIAEFRSFLKSGSQLSFQNVDEFARRVESSKVLGFIASFFSVNSELTINLEKASISFYGQDDASFNGDHVKLINRVLPDLRLMIRNIQAQSGSTIQRNKSTGATPARPEFPHIIGRSAKLLSALDQAAQVAPYETSVLILGETGTGKEALVDVIHQLSPRSTKPLIKINCAAIPETILESELFGHERGAFTGAIERRIGKFEQAQGGTLFLDEIGELPFEVQSKLLRALQEKEIERIGGRQTIKTDVRLIAATNRNLYREVASGTFRMDLYYRLNVFPINLPPLRDRKEDIPLLVTYFLKQLALLQNARPKAIDAALLQKLIGYSWPGNVRQLQHLIERFVIMSPGMVISGMEIPEEEVGQPVPDLAVNNKSANAEEQEKLNIMAVLKMCKGKIAGKGGAAEILQIPVTTLRYKMKKFGIGWQYFHDENHSHNS